MSSEHDRLSGMRSTRRPGWTGRWASGASHLLDPVTGSESRDLATSEDIDAIASLRQTLEEAAATGSWKQFVGAPLLAGHDEDTLRLEQRERLLSEKLPSIAHITERFITRLGERAELLPVARVKRPARRALERLAAHTEDWAGRTLSGPVPRRALAVTRDEDANLYENRMVAELVHPILSSALLARIRKLRRLVSDLAELNPAQHVGTYQRTERLYSFWGDDAEKAAESHVQAAATLEALEKLAAWIQALRGSALLLLLKGKSTGQRSLRRTNVIINDRHYRASGEVWTAFERPEMAVESAEDKQERLVGRLEAFDLYVLGLVVRALNDLGYRPAADSLPGPGESVALVGSWGQADLFRGQDGVLTLMCLESSTRIVPLIDVLGPDDDHEALGERWGELEAAAQAPTLVVYLAGAAAIRNNPDHGLAAAMSSARDDALVSRGALVGVPASPLETTSLERVARGVSSALRIPPLIAYPPEIVASDGPLPARIVDHLVSADIGQRNLSPLFAREDGLRLRRPLTPTEQTSLDAVVADLSAGVRGSDWQRDFGKYISGLKASFERAAASVLLLLTCPVCSEQAGAGSVQREGDVFKIKCLNCGTRWGHERCGNCQARIPIIEPDQRLLNPEITGPGWVERIYGQDALSSPCWARTAANRYICPECRVCPLANEARGSGCSRCH